MLWEAGSHVQSHWTAAHPGQSLDGLSQAAMDVCILGAGGDGGVGSALSRQGSGALGLAIAIISVVGVCSLV